MTFIQSKPSKVVTHLCLLLASDLRVSQFKQLVIKKNIIEDRCVHEKVVLQIRF